MSMIKAWLHDQMEKECREDEMFYNADMHHQMEQAMREEMDPPEEEVDPTYENFIANHPDGKYPPTNEDNDSNEVPF
jgi:hypothetical protein